MDHNDKAKPQGIVATIGSFDGIHQGHSHVLQTLIDQSKTEGLKSAIITFTPHPRIVIEGTKSNLTLLNSLNEQKHQLAKCGVDHIITLEFNKELQALTAREFVEQILIDKLNISTLLVGYNHHLGSDRILASTIIGEYNNINIIALERLDISTQKVSSTIIRSAITKGDIAAANIMLGYNYIIITKIDAYGRLIGIDSRKVLPPNGEYAAKFDDLDIVLRVADKELKISQILPDCVDYNKLHIFEIVEKIS